MYALVVAGYYGTGVWTGAGYGGRSRLEREASMPWSEPLAPSLLGSHLGCLEGACSSPGREMEEGAYDKIMQSLLCGVNWVRWVWILLQVHTTNPLFVERRDTRKFTCEPTAGRVKHRGSSSSHSLRPFSFPPPQVCSLPVPPRADGRPGHGSRERGFGAWGLGFRV